MADKETSNRMHAKDQSSTCNYKALQGKPKRRELVAKQQICSGQAQESKEIIMSKKSRLGFAYNISLVRSEEKTQPLLSRNKMNVR